ncbi:unnamed protein product [Parnassius apollo]|uniref:(apollo) hypothetical protein n=1 Tax=Parnassius apollo TaxID=110799 RepID=A0A8S3XU68_PARAO|nr:unnamed protein product [Parnassius apollo]
MPTKLCYFGCKLDVPMHRFPKPGYYNEARFNMWLLIVLINTELWTVKTPKLQVLLKLNIKIKELKACHIHDNILEMVSTGSSMMNIHTEISDATEAGSKKKDFYIEKIKNFKTYQQLKTRLLKLQNKCKEVKKSYRVAKMSCSHSEFFSKK